MKRYRPINAKPGQLIARYGRIDRHNLPDLNYAWGGHGASKPDARVLSNAFEGIAVFEGKCLREVLEDRGYDITTLRFSIEMKKAEVA